MVGLLVDWVVAAVGTEWMMVVGGGHWLRFQWGWLWKGRGPRAGMGLLGGLMQMRTQGSCDAGADVGAGQLKVV